MRARHTAAFTEALDIEDLNSGSLGLLAGPSRVSDFKIGKQDEDATEYKRSFLDAHDDHTYDSFLPSSLT